MRKYESSYDNFDDDEAEEQQRKFKSQKIHESNSAFINDVNSDALRLITRVESLKSSPSRQKTITKAEQKFLVDDGPRFMVGVERGSLEGKAELFFNALSNLQ